jgi:hypothetical protein
MPILLSEDASLGVVYEELYYTLTMARLNPEASALVPDAEALCKACLGMQSRERAFAEALMFAESRIGQVGRNLERYLDRVEPTLTEVLSGKESTLPSRLFAGRTTSQLKQQVAAGDLEALRSWPEQFEEAGTKALADLARDLRALLTSAENARNALADAKLRAADFRNGARRGFWDTCNAKRRDAHRLLTKIAAEKAGLGPEFVERFFRAGSGELPSEETIEHRLKAEIAELSGRLTDRQAQLDSLRARREAELNREAELKLEAEKKREAEQKRAAGAGPAGPRRGAGERTTAKAAVLPTKVPAPAAKAPTTPAKAPTAPVKASTAPAKAPTVSAKAPTVSAKAPTAPAKAPTAPAKAPTAPAKAARPASKGKAPAVKAAAKKPKGAGKVTAARKPKKK